MLERGSLALCQGPRSRSCECGQQWKTGFGRRAGADVGCQDCHDFVFMHISNIVVYRAKLVGSPHITLCLCTRQAKGVFNGAI
jgi:hypothetical protein